VDIQAQGVPVAQPVAKRRRFFVLGASNSGKTPIARHLAAALGIPMVSASEWFRANFPPQGSMSRQEHTDALTRFNNEVMRKDPDHNLRYLREHHKLDEECVIEGFRNPRDFAIEFDPLRDCVIMVRCAETDISPTTFDMGILVIDQYLQYLGLIGMIAEAQVYAVRMERFADIEATVKRYLDLIVPALPQLQREPAGV